MSVQLPCMVGSKKQERLAYSRRSPLRNRSQSSYEKLDVFLKFKNTSSQKFKILNFFILDIVRRVLSTMYLI